MLRIIEVPKRTIEYRGYLITRNFEVIDTLGISYARCDSLFDARETIDEYIEAKADAMETQGELSHWIESMCS